MMRRALLSLLVVSGWASTVSAAEDAWPPKDGVVIDQIIALVGSEPITLYELDRATGPYVQRVRASGGQVTEAHTDTLRLELLQSLIDERLILNEAKKMKNLEVSPADIEKEVASLKAKRGWDDTQLVEVLRQAGFRNLAAFKKHRARQRLIELVLRFKVHGRARVDEGEVNAAVEAELGKHGGLVERRAAHILVRADEFVTPDRVSEITTNLDALRTRILAGEISFEDAARKHSEDPAGRAGGDTGWFSKGDFAPSFETAIDKLSVGEVSQPTRTEFGFHLIKLIEVRREEVSASKRKELTAQIRMRMLQAESARLHEHWVQSLRRNTFIEERPLPPLPATRR